MTEQERLEQISLVEEEIRFIDSFSCIANCERDELARQRILVARQTALVNLKKGMKEQGNG